MKTLRNLIYSLCALVALAPSLASAQYQVPKYSIPIGRGGGVAGFDSTAPGPADFPLVSKGPTSIAAFKPLNAFGSFDIRNYATGGQTPFTVCTGAGDDTATFQLAYDTLSGITGVRVGGATINLPSGVCNIGTINLTNYANVTLTGRGSGWFGATRLNYTGTDISQLFKMDGSVNMTFERMQIGYASATYGGDLMDLRQEAGLQNTFGITFSDISFFGASGSANSFIRLGSGPSLTGATLNTYVSKSYFSGAHTSILGGQSANGVFIGPRNWFNQSSVITSGTHIGAMGEGWSLVSNIFEPTTVAGNCNNVTLVGDVNALFMAGNTFNDCAGVNPNTIVKLTGGVARGFAMTGNILQGSFFSVDVGAAQGVSITANAFSANAICNVIVSSAGGSVVVKGNSNVGTAVCAFPASGSYDIDALDGHGIYTRGIAQLGLSKLSAVGAAPGAGNGYLYLIPGTTGTSCKLVIIAGTSATPVTIVDNAGTNC